MTIYEMNLDQLTEYRAAVDRVAGKYDQAGESLLASLTRNGLRAIDEQLNYLDGMRIRSEA